MTQVTLRDYQRKLIDEVRTHMGKGSKNPLLVLPTGGGKTVCFSYLAQSAVNKNKKVLILAHRDFLLDQIAQTLSKFQVVFSYIAAGRLYDPSVSLQIGSVQTVINRLHLLKNFDFVIVDEAHHLKKGATYYKILSHVNTFTLGVTATPCRLSGEALGDFFTSIVKGPSMDWLIENKYLCDYDLIAPKNDLDFSKVGLKMGDFNKKESEEMVDKKVIIGSVINEYKKHVNGKRAVVFCISVNHAKKIAMEFRESGIPAMHIDGSMNHLERNLIMRNFKEGSVKVLTNCQIVTEGFDLPSLDSVIQLRPTASLSLYLQMVGRALRTNEGKQKAIIIDHVKNYKRHSLPDIEHDWSLEGKVKASKADKPPSVRYCEKCLTPINSRALKCYNCGSAKVVTPRTDNTKFKEGVLSKIDKDKLKKQKNINRLAAQAKAVTLQELTDLGKERGYKRPRLWAKKVFNARQSKILKGDI